LALLLLLGLLVLLLLRTVLLMLIQQLHSQQTIWRTDRGQLQCRPKQQCRQQSAE
jgi:hypothetical protein